MMNVNIVGCVQVETEGLRRSIQNLGVLLTTAAVAHTSVATGEGLRHAATGQHHTVTVTTKDKVLSSSYFAFLLFVTCVERILFLCFAFVTSVNISVQFFLSVYIFML